MIKIYTDGACSGNPGKGASAMIVVEGNDVTHRGTFLFKRTTNNIAELTAVMMALDYVISKEILECRILSDSQYVVNGINAWMNKWAANGWIASHGKEVKNAELWQNAYELWNKAIALSNCSIHHVKGHHTDKWNILVDKIAVHALKEIK